MERRAWNIMLTLLSCISLQIFGMTDKIVVLSTCSTEDEAVKLARLLVEERLAACVNIVPGIESYYRWQGAVETADEVAAIFKADDHTVDALMTRIAGLHSYDVPCIVTWPVGKLLRPYAAWVEDSVG